jgi:hypothetical protein
MRYVPYVDFATHRRATARIHLYFKRLIFTKYFVIKNGLSHREGNEEGIRRTRKKKEREKGKIWRDESDGS